MTHCDCPNLCLVITPPDECGGKYAITRHEELKFIKALVSEIVRIYGDMASKKKSDRNKYVIQFVDDPTASVPYVKVCPGYLIVHKDFTDFIAKKEIECRAKAQSFKKAVKFMLEALGKAEKEASKKTSAVPTDYKEATRLLIEETEFLGLMSEEYHEDKHSDEG